MASLLTSFNKLLPFATPGTPLLQDLVHLAAICLVLYFAPQIQEWNRQRGQHTPAAPNAVNTGGDDAVEQEEEAAETEEAATHTNVEPAVHDVVVADEPAEAHINQPAVDDESDDDDDEPGPATPRAVGERNVGAKKAKSLARKDQRRAYNEFMRSQGEAQRARDAEGAAEREATLEAEKKRRAQAEAELAAKRAKEREAKREAEQAEREAEYQRRETAVAIVKADLLARNLSDLHKVAAQVGGDVDVEWVEKVIHASGVVGRKDNVLTIITTTGWAARITEADARAFYAQAAVADIANEHGLMDEGEVSKTLVSVLAASAVAVHA